VFVIRPGDHPPRIAARDAGRGLFAGEVEVHRIRWTPDFRRQSLALSPARRAFFLVLSVRPM
jgi:hypothetical protein